jgi:hypothetical protein
MVEEEDVIVRVKHTILQLNSSEFSLNRAE